MKSSADDLVAAYLAKGGTITRVSGRAMTESEMRRKVEDEMLVIIEPTKKERMTSQFSISGGSVTLTLGVEGDWVETKLKVSQTALSAAIAAALNK